jgi:hypothetical protein
MANCDAYMLQLSHGLWLTGQFDILSLFLSLLMFPYKSVVKFPPIPKNGCCYFLEDNLGTFS